MLSRVFDTQGTERLGQDLLDKMDANLALFQQLCKAAIFNVPPVHAVQVRDALQ
jgi:hypothetical protein